MPERERKQKPAPEGARRGGRRGRAPAKQGEKIKEELDDLLDEIDRVLEENAEEFVQQLRAEGRRVSPLSVADDRPACTRLRTIRSYSVARCER